MGRNFVLALILCAAFLFSPGCSKSASGGSSSPTISITSPADGSRINRDKAFVSGEFTSSSPNFGLSVNDIPAAVQGNRFFVYVPFRNRGENIIFAKIVESNGNSAEKAITVYHEGATQPLILSANVFSGTPPLTVSFSLSFTSPSPAALYEVDFDGDGKFDYSSEKRGEIAWTYTSPGLFTVNAKAPDRARNSASDQMTIIISATSEVVAALESKWNEFTSALRNKDISGAVSCLEDEARPRYQTIFFVLTDKLPDIFAQPEKLQFVYMREDYAVCNSLVNENGTKMSYPVTFARDRSGLWKIRNF